MRFAHRNAAYRIIHNLRPPKILKETKHRREGNTEPSDPHTYSQDNRNFGDIHEETEGYSQFWAGYSSALPWEWNTLHFRMQETKRTRECPTVARGQGLSGQWEPDPSSHLPNCCHILSHHYLNTSCGAKTRNTSLHTQLSTSTPHGHSSFCCRFRLFNICRMAELSQSLCKHPHPGEDC